jgi:hypothetical protein
MDETPQQIPNQQPVEPQPQPEQQVPIQPEQPVAMPQKPKTRWFLIVLVLVIALAAYLGAAYWQNMWPFYEEKVVEESPTPTPAVTEEASGLVKSVYSESGKNYLDIDYIEINPNWQPGGRSGAAFQNNDSEIRTFEISPNAKFVINYPPGEYISFSEFQNIFTSDPTKPWEEGFDFRVNNPWDIVVVDDMVIEITERFYP